MPEKISKPLRDFVLLIDRKYIEPALVTLVSLFRYVEYTEKISVHIIFNILSDDDEKAKDACLQMLSYLPTDNTYVKLNMYVLQGSPFGTYSRFHFNSTILNKLAIPHLIGEGVERLLYVDAGIVFGDQFSNFINSAGTCEPLALRAFGEMKFNPIAGKETLYPSGALIMFDCGNYRERAVLQRALDFFSANQKSLNYAEQEIVFYITTTDELGMFENKYNKIHLDLASFCDWVSLGEIFSTIKSKDYLYWKHTGSCKPWLKEIRSPLVAPYILARNKLPQAVLQALQLCGNFSETTDFAPGFDIETNQKSIYSDYLNYITT
jgi:lipopolysaccharide biosynthesis glycosyltransferase